MFFSLPVVSISFLTVDEQAERDPDEEGEYMAFEQLMAESMKKTEKKKEKEKEKDHRHNHHGTDKEKKTEVEPEVHRH